MQIPNQIKQYLKRGAQHISSRIGPHTRRHNHPQLLILMYHRVLPAPDKRCRYEEPGMIVYPESFKLHLEIIAESMTFIDLAEWVERKNNGHSLPKKACAITFDDGWADNYEFAFPILKEKSVPATIYLVSDMISTNKQFWPERLARTLSQLTTSKVDVYSHSACDWLNSIHPIQKFEHELPTGEQISRIINCAKSFSDDELHSRIDMIESIPGFNKSNQEPSLLNWKQLLEMTGSGIVEVGSHTRHHIRLGDNTTDETMNDEIINSKIIIEEHTGKPVKTFCFPNGNFCGHSMNLVQKHYSSAVTTKWGWNSTTSDSHLLNRVGVHQHAAYDKTAFLANLSGWM